MITRPKMSRNEWKLTERGALKKARKSYRFSNPRYLTTTIVALSNFDAAARTVGVDAEVVIRVEFGRAPRAAVAAVCDGLSLDFCGVAVAIGLEREACDAARNPTAGLGVPLRMLQSLVPLVASNSLPAVSSGPSGSKAPRSSPTPGESVPESSFRNILLSNRILETGLESTQVGGRVDARRARRRRGAGVPRRRRRRGLRRRVPGLPL